MRSNKTLNQFEIIKSLDNFDLRFPNDNSYIHKHLLHWYLWQQQLQRCSEQQIFWLLCLWAHNERSLCIEQLSHGHVHALHVRYYVSLQSENLKFNSNSIQIIINHIEIGKNIPLFRKTKNTMASQWEKEVQRVNEDCSWITFVKFPKEIH